MNIHPFQDHKKYYQLIPIQDRSSFLANLLNTPQLPGSPIIYNIPYPNQATFNYQTYTLNYHYSESTNTPKAILVFLHGLYSYGGNSGYLAVNITNSIKDVNFYSLDFINFGKSTGDCRGYIRSFQYLVQQGQFFVDLLLQKFPEKPKVFLVGESLGGAIAFKMSLRQPEKYNGIIFLNPALREIKQSQYYMKKLGKVLGYLVPKLRLTSQSFNTSSKYDIQQIMKSNQNIYNDRHRPGSVRVALNAMEEIQLLYKQFKTNYILFQGGVDKAVDVFAPLDLEKQSKGTDKTTVYIKTMWHSTFYEQQVKEITQIAINWLSKRI